MNMVAAVVARIRLAGSYLVMLRDALARRAKDAFGVEVVLEPFKASIIVRELLLEILEALGCLFFIGCFLSTYREV
jgi:hypothetical protein